MDSTLIIYIWPVNCSLYQYNYPHLQLKTPQPAAFAGFANRATNLILKNTITTWIKAPLYICDILFTPQSDPYQHAHGFSLNYDMKAHIRAKHMANLIY